MTGEETAAPDSPILLKLGGSVITDKDRNETIDREGLEVAAAAIGDHDGANLVVVHGGGSFGHPVAEQAGVSPEAGTTDAAAIREIHAAMGRLNDVVLEGLAREGVPAVPIRPFSAGLRNRDGDVHVRAEAIQAALGEGFVPVLHGDVLTSMGQGATILSGDELIVTLAEALGARSVGLCTTVPGVLDGEGSVVESIDSFEAVADVLGGSASTDVTGGMAGKVRALLGLEADAQIFDLEGLPAFLAGERPGTRVVGSS
jgi:isopentenyl phosphate kinase